MSPSGEVVTNAEVVRVVNNAYLIWRRGAGGGMIKLADLREDLRSRFGYDADKAAAMYAAQERKEAAQAAAPQTETAPLDDFLGGGGYSSYSAPSSGGGRVFVHGYTRKDGTYVQSYTRKR